jgi:hypothetical protein
VLAAAQQPPAANDANAAYGSIVQMHEPSLQAKLLCPCSRRMAEPGGASDSMPAAQGDGAAILCGKPDWQLHMCSRLSNPAGLVDPTMTSVQPGAWHVPGTPEQQHQQQPAACNSRYCRAASRLQQLLQAYPAPAAWAMVGLAACNLLLLINQFRQPKQGMQQEVLSAGHSAAAAVDVCSKQPVQGDVAGASSRLSSQRAGAAHRHSSYGLAVAAHLELPAGPSEDEEFERGTEPFASAWMAAPPLQRTSAAAATTQEGAPQDAPPRRRSSAAAAVVAVAAAASKLKDAMQAHYSRAPAVAEQQLEGAGREMREVGDDLDAGWTRDTAGRLIRAGPWASGTPSGAAASSLGRAAGGAPGLAAAAVMPGSTGRSREIWHLGSGGELRDQGAVL